MNTITSFSYPQTLYTNNYTADASAPAPAPAPALAANDYLERLKKSQHILEKYPEGAEMDFA